MVCVSCALRLVLLFVFITSCGTNVCGRLMTGVNVYHDKPSVYIDTIGTPH